MRSQNRLLLGVPNLSEGSDERVVSQLEGCINSSSAVLLDTHSDPDHGRTVLTVAGQAKHLAESLAELAAKAVEQIDISNHPGVHPHIGVIDVAPVVYLKPEDRGAAVAEALLLADLLGSEVGIPVFLYGQLAAGRSRAELRRGGVDTLIERIGSADLVPDFGPKSIARSTGAVLVTAREPLIAFNYDLDPTVGLDTAKQLAATIREGSADGLPGVRALALQLRDQGRLQISTNIESYWRCSPLAVLRAIEAEQEVLSTELIGLAPAKAFEGFPAQLLPAGIVDGSQVVEQRIKSLSSE